MRPTAPPLCNASGCFADEVVCLCHGVCQSLKSKFSTAPSSSRTSVAVCRHFKLNTTVAASATHHIQLPGKRQKFANHLKYNHRPLFSVFFTFQLQTKAKIWAQGSTVTVTVPEVFAQNLHLGFLASHSVSNVQPLKKEAKVRCAQVPGNPSREHLVE